MHRKDRELPEEEQKELMNWSCCKGINCLSGVEGHFDSSCVLNRMTVVLREDLHPFLNCNFLSPNCHVSKPSTGRETPFSSLQRDSLNSEKNDGSGKLGLKEFHTLWTKIQKYQVRTTFLGEHAIRHGGGCRLICFTQCVQSHFPKQGLSPQLTCVCVLSPPRFVPWSPGVRLLFLQALWWRAEGEATSPPALLWGVSGLF